MKISRREFLGATALLGGCSASPSLAPSSGRAKRVAAIQTCYYIRSHAYHIAGRFIHGYPVNGVHHQPEHRLVRMCNDQYPAHALSPELAKKKGLEISDTVAPTR